MTHTKKAGSLSTKREADTKPTGPQGIQSIRLARFVSNSTMKRRILGEAVRHGFGHQDRGTGPGYHRDAPSRCIETNRDTTLPLISTEINLHFQDKLLQHMLETRCDKRLSSPDENIQVDSWRAVGLRVGACTICEESITPVWTNRHAILVS